MQRGYTVSTGIPASIPDCFLMGAVFFVLRGGVERAWNRREEKGIVRNSCGLGRAADA